MNIQLVRHLVPAIGVGLALLSGGASLRADDSPPRKEPVMETAMFGSGCFWCSEAVFEQVSGVSNVVSGFAGGHTDHPTYKQVCTGDTGHAEVVRIEFNPDVVSYRTLVDLFWKIHDPTSLNRQGADVGSQYRSVIFTFRDEQKAVAEASRAEAQKKYDRPIVTEITPAAPFTPAGPEHEDYFRRNPDNGYCRAVIAPKLHKLEKDIPKAP